MAEYAKTEAPAIVFDRVSLRFGERFLFREFSVQLNGGQCTCVLGPSGCGKSTLLKLITGNTSLNPSGIIRFDAGPATANKAAWMGQNDLLLPWMSLLENILLGARLRGQVSESLRDTALELVAEAGLAGYEDALPATLSGGMRQRAALLRTLMEDRPVLLMDEPFSALDALTRVKLQNLAARMTRGKTVLLVTHDPMEALRMGDYVVVLAGEPAAVVTMLSLGGSTPRDPGNPDVVGRYPQLLAMLMSEGRE